MIRTIHIVRHGESAANVGLKTDDPGAYPLTELGHAHAAQAAAQLRPSVSRIITSPYTRAQQTAAPLARLSGITPEVWDIQEFLFLDPVICAGTTPAERRELRDAYWAKGDPEWKHSPATESFEDFSRRVARCRRALETLPDGAVLFGHGLFFMTLLLQFHHFDSEVAQWMEMAHRLVYREERNLRNGQILTFQASAGAWMSFPDIP